MFITYYNTHDFPRTTLNLKSMGFQFGILLIHRPEYPVKLAETTAIPP